jgi:hypothetical protein
MEVNAAPGENRQASRSTSPLYETHACAANLKQLEVNPPAGEGEKKPPPMPMGSLEKNPLL